ncbi:MaoC family dehydratase N-terminal domain-containing protein [Aeromicrobium sp. CFBP 8757]|uniref:MaoC/PaaZ C-terminal domain-containing protein n=1 Tax=Aeromicrobium sp. CFBP 8757 TaxID=2775288 RepID=UPI00177FADC6|nr:MaoC/PaaZ C-terminal domain-containing protein [Aeromicrobium sp. CFBP 8757]MBD8606728.1 MaoC family dehydratase N-terminal domain-containing protein [Aeromicrobium sp. CFBP 8757]
MTGPGPWFLEDFAVGQVLTTQARTVTEADVVAFAASTWDTNEVHTDAVAAADGRFGERIAHGLLGMSYAMGLVSRLGVFEGSSVALLGVEDWRFVAPVRIGDTITCRLEIVGVRRTSAGDTGVVDRLFTLVDQRGGIVQQGRIPLMVRARDRT